MTDIMEPRIESRRQSNPDNPFLWLFRGEIWQSLKKKAGGRVSILDRAAFVVDEVLGRYFILAIGFLYLIFRVCIIVLALISLRSMPDPVCDATWAKNISSVQRWAIR